MENTEEVSREPSATFVKEEQKIVQMSATAQEIAALDALYGNRQAFHGDIHDHAKTGPKSDGHETLSAWKENLAALNMDFQAILDHRQVKHMYLPEWEDSIFIGGTEAASSSVHYNLIVRDVKDLEEILQKYDQFYEFNGGKDGVAMEDGTFNYRGIGKETMCSIIADLKAKGGMFVLAHPLQSGSKIGGVEDYWYCDYTGFEVFYQEYSNEYSKENYDMWVKMLAAGKRVWATAGCDRHRKPDAKALTTVYAQECRDDALLSPLSVGDFTCGFVGIRMSIGSTLMGSSTDFAGKRLVISVGDYHEFVAREGRRYRVDVITEKGVVASTYTDGLENCYFSMDADESSAFYRVEIHDESRKHPLIAIGQPIWND
jgi:hypothetical protein